MKFTVLGSSGFIGGRLVRYLREAGYDVDAPPRETESLQGKKLGHVIYAIGMTGNFRGKSHETVEAHVNLLQKLMREAEFDSWLYLSSTRVYAHLSPETPASEKAFIPVRPGADSIYDLSKLLGEALCLGADQPSVRVARLSNVYGAGMSPHLFIGSLMQDLLQHKTVTIREAPGSSKDYISVDEVVKILVSIALSGKERLYNVAAGQAVTHADLAKAIEQCGYKPRFEPAAPVRVFPPVDISQLVKEFGRPQSSITEDFPSVIKEEGNRKK